MLGTEFEYNPHIKPTINSGGAVRYWDEQKSRSAFPADQIKELSPLLNVKK